jgi:hypothetical protein
MAVVLGKYKHYKGNVYIVDVIGVHTETLEQVVVYHAADAAPPRKFWVRPEAMFDDTVQTPDGPKPRFEFICEVDKDD